MEERGKCSSDEFSFFWFPGEVSWPVAVEQVYIYSSGSREAQRLIFGNSNYGDLRKYLSGYFDTTTG